MGSGLSPSMKEDKEARQDRVASSDDEKQRMEGMEAGDLSPLVGHGEPSNDRLAVPD